MSPVHLRAASGLALASLFLTGALPAAAQEKLTIAIFAPNAPFESGDARYAFISRLAQQIATGVDMTVEPKAYARSQDLEAAVQKNEVDLAVLDGIYLAERGVPYPVIATATSGGDTYARWVLYSSESGGIGELQGKRLVYVSTASRDSNFIDNGLLDGELPKHFGARQTTPDLASAITTVVLKKAECVFAPEGQGRGLHRVFEGPRVPNPALVQVSSALRPELVTKIRQVVLASNPSGTYEGWRAGSTEPYRALATRLSPKTRRPVMTEPDVVQLDGVQVTPLPLEPLLTELKDQYWHPTGTP
jgi:ABC-type amino acid transport substrate-binding protein